MGGLAGQPQRGRMPSRPLPGPESESPRRGPGCHDDGSTGVTWRPPRRGHRCGLDRKEGAGAASRGPGGRACPERGAGPDPAGPVGGAWALPEEAAWHRAPGAPRARAPRSPGPAPGAPRAASPARSRPPRDGRGGSVRGGVGGRARCRKAAPPWEALGSHQVTSIPSRRTRSFGGKRAPARSPGAKPPSAPSCAG